MLSMQEEMERLENAVLLALKLNPGASLSELAVALGWVSLNGQPDKKRVLRILLELQHQGLVERQPGPWGLTAKGTAEVERADHATPADPTTRERRTPVTDFSDWGDSELIAVAPESLSTDDLIALGEVVEDRRSASLLLMGQGIIDVRLDAVADLTAARDRIVEALHARRADPEEAEVAERERQAWNRRAGVIKRLLAPQG